MTYLKLNFEIVEPGDVSLNIAGTDLIGVGNNVPEAMVALAAEIVARDYEIDEDIDSLLREDK